MHPNAFLRTFWRMDFEPQVFVAMSFDEAYRGRFENVIAPAIRGIELNGKSLEPFRVDISKSGDSILTDILDGISHSQFILADVSTIGHDSKSGHPYRNGNVMYELGIALACRHSSEVLLIRDDKDKFLFDVSTIPHMHLDFADPEARRRLHEELVERIRKRDYFQDARVQMVLASLDAQEHELLIELSRLPQSAVRGWQTARKIMNTKSAAICRLLDKRIISAVGKFDLGVPAYRLTPMGRRIAQAAEMHWETFVSDKEASEGKNEGTKSVSPLNDPSQT